MANPTSQQLARAHRKGIPSRLQIGRPAHGSFQARSGGALPRSFRSRNDRKGLGTTDNGTIFAFRRYSAARSGWVSRMAALLLHLPVSRRSSNEGGYASYGRTSGNFVGTVCEGR